MRNALIDDALWAASNRCCRNDGAASAIRRPETDRRPRGVDRASCSCCAAGLPWNMLPREMGCGSGHDVLAAAGAVAAGRRLEAVAHGCCSPNCAGAAGSIWRGPSSTALDARAARGKRTGPNPTDRRKAGSKHHLLTDARGIPLVATLTAANRNDITQLLPLVDAFPPVSGRRGPTGAPAATDSGRPRLRLAAASRRAATARASPPTRQARHGRTAAAWAARAGSSSGPWRGCIGFVAWRAL